MLPTFAGLAEVSDKVPTDRVIDGVDQQDLLLGEDDGGARDGFLYYESGELQAVRHRHWKLRLPGLKKIRNWTEVDRGTQETELYNLAHDIGETKNVAADHPDVVRKLMALAGKAKGS